MNTKEEKRYWTNWAIKQWRITAYGSFFLIFLFSPALGLMNSFKVVLPLNICIYLCMLIIALFIVVVERLNPYLFKYHYLFILIGRMLVGAVLLYIPIIVNIFYLHSYLASMLILFMAVLISTISYQREKWRLPQVLAQLEDNGKLDFNKGIYSPFVHFRGAEEWGTTNKKLARFLDGPIWTGLTIPLMLILNQFIRTNVYDYKYTTQAYIVIYMVLFVDFIFIHLSFSDLYRYLFCLNWERTMGRNIYLDGFKPRGKK